MSFMRSIMGMYNFMSQNFKTVCNWYTNPKSTPYLFARGSPHVFNYNCHGVFWFSRGVQNIE